jgi:hypothetical protein
VNQQPRESLSSRIVAPLLVVVLGAILVGGSAPWWWERIFPPRVTPSPGQTFTPTVGPTTASGETPATTSASPTPPVAGCVLTISNPFASIREEPSHSSMEVGDVPQGEYPTSNTRIVNWGGRDERWFEITASGRTGWIVYDNILVESKSSECP